MTDEQDDPMADVSEPLDLDAIRGREEAATEGPWEVSHWTEGGKSTHHTICRFETRSVRGVERGGFLKRQVAMTYIDAQGHKDFEFIANARTDVPALIAEVERLRADLSAAGDMGREDYAELRSLRATNARVNAVLHEYSAMRARNDDIKFGSDVTIKAIRAAIGGPS